MRGATPVRVITVLIGISLALSALILTRAELGAEGLVGRRVFHAEDPPQAVEALLHVAGLSLADGDHGHHPLASMEAKAIAGMRGDKLTLKGIGFMPATMLTDPETKMNFKAQKGPLMPGERMTTARGGLFPMLGFEGLKMGDSPLVEVMPKGDTMLFGERAPGEYEPLRDMDVSAGKFMKNKAMSPPFSSPFALAGKIMKKDGNAIGMIKMPVLEYRMWAMRIQAMSKAGRGGMVKKMLPGSLTMLNDGDLSGEPYVDETRLKNFQLKVGLRGGEPAMFDIRKKPR